MTTLYQISCPEKGRIQPLEARPDLTASGIPYNISTFSYKQDYANKNFTLLFTVTSFLSRILFTAG